MATGTIVKTNVDSVEVIVDKDAQARHHGKQFNRLPAGDRRSAVSKDRYNQSPPNRFTSTKIRPSPYLLASGNDRSPRLPRNRIDPGAAVKVDSQAWGTVGADGKLRVQVEPKATYVVQLQANNADTWIKTVGPVKADQTLSVPANLSIKPLPTVELFSGPSEVSAGQTVKIAWATSHAKTVDIEGVGADLSPIGEKDVTVNQSTTYTLTAKGDGGSSPTKTLSISVKAAAPKAPSVTSFKPSPARIQQGDTTALYLVDHRCPVRHHQRRRRLRRQRIHRFRQLKAPPTT